MDDALEFDPFSHEHDANPCPRDRFDIGRHAKRHLGFGYGRHFCLGAGLARLEVRSTLEEIHRCIPDYEADCDGVDPMYGGHVVGFSRVPIRCTLFGRE